MPQQGLRADHLASRIRLWLARFNGSEVSSALEGTPRASASGESLAIVSRLSLFVPLPDTRSAEERLVGELRLLFGIGTARDRALRSDGYTSIPSLLAHPRWGEAARGLLGAWGSPPDLARAYESLCAWLPASHPLFLQLLPTVPREEILFLDLESLGLCGAPVFLVAAGRPRQDGLQVTQYLARSLDEEVPVLEQIGRELEAASILLTYNGKAFDWTILMERSAYYGVSLPRPPVHIDLLHHARRAFRAQLGGVGLRTVETEILSVERVDDLPSEDVPEHYVAYLETGNPGPLVPVVRHNRQDIATLALLVSRLFEEENGN